MESPLRRLVAFAPAWGRHGKVQEIHLSRVSASTSGMSTVRLETHHRNAQLWRIVPSSWEKSTKTLQDTILNKSHRNPEFSSCRRSYAASLYIQFRHYQPSQQLPNLKVDRHHASALLTQPSNSAETHANAECTRETVENKADLGRWLGKASAYVARCQDLIMMACVCESSINSLALSLPGYY